MSSETLYVVLGLVNIPLYLFLGKLIFNSWSEFGDAIGFWFKPDMWSAIDGEYWDDVVAEFKLGIFFAICAGAVFGEHFLIFKHFLSGS